MLNIGMREIHEVSVHDLTTVEQLALMSKIRWVMPFEKHKRETVRHKILTVLVF